MANTVRALGGDAQFSEALYKLLVGRGAGKRRVGRAAEIEFAEGRTLGMEFFLSASCNGP